MGTKTKYKSLILIFSILFVIGIGVSPFFNMNPLTLNNEGKLDSISNNASNLLLSTNELDRVQWEETQYGNDGFETWTGNNAYYWSEHASQHRYHWYANSPWPVNEGSQSIGMQAKSYQQDSIANARWWQGGFTATLVNLTLTFDWYLESNGDPQVDRDQFYIRCQLDNGKWIEYWLNGTTSVGNVSTAVYYLLDEPSQTWNTLSRNITDDYVNAPGFGSPIGVNLIYVYIDMYNRGYSTEYTRAFIDDFNLVNELSVGDVTWIGGSTRNGNFESTVDWKLTGNGDGSNIKPTTDAATGTYAVNCSTFSQGNTSSTTL
ncbi:MAG: hypothetical protein ACTSUV_05360, partial [Candidatus Ranarchaeia archaeon]